MYRFNAKYYNIDTDTETTKEIYFDGQFFNSEREIYCYAMGKAFDLTAKNECFVSIELISC